MPISLEEITTFWNLVDPAKFSSQHPAIHFKAEDLRKNFQDFLKNIDRKKDDLEKRIPRSALLSRLKQLQREHSIQEKLSPAELNVLKKLVDDIENKEEKNQGNELKAFVEDFVAAEAKEDRVIENKAEQVPAIISRLMARTEYEDEAKHALHAAKAEDTEAMPEELQVAPGLDANLIRELNEKLRKEKAVEVEKKRKEKLAEQLKKEGVPEIKRSNERYADAAALAYNEGKYEAAVAYCTEEMKILDAEKKEMPAQRQAALGYAIIQCLDELLSEAKIENSNLTKIEAFNQNLPYMLRGINSFFNWKLSPENKAETTQDAMYSVARTFLNIWFKLFLNGIPNNHMIECAASLQNTYGMIGKIVLDSLSPDQANQYINLLKYSLAPDTAAGIINLLKAQDENRKTFGIFIFEKHNENILLHYLDLLHKLQSLGYKREVLEIIKMQTTEGFLFGDLFIERDVIISSVNHLKLNNEPHVLKVAHQDQQESKMSLELKAAEKYFSLLDSLRHGEHAVPSNEIEALLKAQQTRVFAIAEPRVLRYTSEEGHSPAIDPTAGDMDAESQTGSEEAVSARSVPHTPRGKKSHMPARSVPHSPRRRGFLAPPSAAPQIHTTPDRSEQHTPGSPHGKKPQ